MEEINIVSDCKYYFQLLRFITKFIGKFIGKILHIKHSLSGQN